MNRSRVLAVLFATAVILCGATLDGQSIVTIAGGAALDGRPATASRLVAPKGVAVDIAGNVLISDGAHVFRVDSSGVMTSIAGNGAIASSGDGGPATRASIVPESLDSDAAGNLFVIDTARTLDNTLRRIDTSTGVIETVAGGGDLTQDGVPATQYRFTNLSDVDLDSHGNIYLTDSTGVLRIDGPTQTVKRIAGGGDADPGDGGPATRARLWPSGVAVDETLRAIYIGDIIGDRIRRIDLASGIISTIAGGGTSREDGIPATTASLYSPGDVALDASGNVFFEAFHRVRKVDINSGILTTVAGSVRGYSGDGGPATAASLDIPTQIAFDSSGALYISDRNNQRVRRVGTDGIITTVAGIGAGGYPFVGDGGPATAALLDFSAIGALGATITGLALDANGNLYISDRGNNRIRRVDGATGVITTTAGTGELSQPNLGGLAVTSPLLGASGIAVDAFGNIYFASGVLSSPFTMVLRINAATGILSRVAGGGQSTEEGVPATDALFILAGGLALDAAGNLYISEVMGHRVRRVDMATGIISTVAGNGELTGPSGDGGPATAARVRNPEGLAFDARGDLYIAEGGNHAVRRVEGGTGIITRVAGNGSASHPLGDGGPATAAGISAPYGIGFDSDGNLYIAEKGSSRIRKVDSVSKIITSIAGVDTDSSSNPIYAGDNGPATRANLAFPGGLVVDAMGNVIFADTNSNRVRAIFACVAMSQPQLVSPAEGSSGVPTAPRLAWNAVRGAFRYDILVDTEDPPHKVAAEDIGTTSISLSNLDPLTTYYWRVVAKGDPYCSPRSTATSEVRSFTTLSTCGAPEAFDVTP